MASTKTPRDSSPAVAETETDKEKERGNSSAVFEGILFDRGDGAAVGAPSVSVTSVVAAAAAANSSTGLVCCSRVKEGNSEEGCLSATKDADGDGGAMVSVEVSTTCVATRGPERDDGDGDGEGGKRIYTTLLEAGGALAALVVREFLDWRQV